MAQSASCLDFPAYTPLERVADRIVHLVGLAGAAAGLGWLASRLGPGATPKQVATLATYGVGLLGMLSASACYNLAGPGRWKAALRRLDHAMIFVMIAGSYTPFALNALSPPLGVPLCVLVWGLAVAGGGLKLAGQDRPEVLFLALYLGMGWLVLGVLHPLWAALPGDTLWLLLVGGIVYSLGALLHARGRLPFHNAAWHAMVVLAAGLHLLAVAQLVS